MKTYVAADFKCPCSRCLGKVPPVKDTLVRLVNNMNVHVNEPDPIGDLVVTSGYRCPEHNEEMGGAPNSEHVQGIACDIEALTSFNHYEIIDAAMAYRATFIEVCPRHVHIDLRYGPPRLVIGIDKG